MPNGGMSLRFTYTFDVGYWSYTTVGVNVDEPFEEEITDPESEELRWVELDEVERLPLHPGFGGAWPALCKRLRRPAMLIVDAANVVGARPDGWWNDRAGATERLLGRLSGLADGVPGQWFDLDDRWRFWPEFVVVVEGQARHTRIPEGQARHAETPEGQARHAEIPEGAAIRLVRAERDGDNAIVGHVAELREVDAVVVTADRELRERVQHRGARAIGPGALYAVLGD